MSISFLIGTDACTGLASLEFFINDGGALVLGFGFDYPFAIAGLPPSALQPGAVYNNGRTLCVVPGSAPSPFAAPVYFGLITPAELLALGGGNLPTDAPTGSLQLYCPAGQIFVA